MSLTRAVFEVGFVCSQVGFVCFNPMSFLSFDIETTGLSCLTSYATVACTHDGEVAQCYHLCRPARELGCTCTPRQADGPPGQGRCNTCREYHSKNAGLLFEALDRADFLCGFNCVRFDIPFLQGRFHIDPARAGRWAAKSVDLFHFASEALGSFFSLDTALRMNGMEAKSGSGALAVQMARRGEWDRLEEYCKRDALLTRQLTLLPRIRVPGPKLGPPTVLCVEWKGRGDGAQAWVVTQEGAVQAGEQVQRAAGRPKRHRMMVGAVRSLFD